GPETVWACSPLDGEPAAPDSTSAAPSSPRAPPGMTHSGSARRRGCPTRQSRRPAAGSLGAAGWRSRRPSPQEGQTARACGSASWPRLRRGGDSSEWASRSTGCPSARSAWAAGLLPRCGGHAVSASQASPLPLVPPAEILERALSATRATGLPPAGAGPAALARPVRVGVIGFGYWGPNLVRNFTEAAGPAVVAVSDLRQERLARVSDRYPA